MIELQFYLPQNLQFSIELFKFKKLYKINFTKSSSLENSKKFYKRKTTAKKNYINFKGFGRVIFHDFFAPEKKTLERFKFKKQSKNAQLYMFYSYLISFECLILHSSRL